jgi:hypothetical protein
LDVDGPVVHGRLPIVAAIQNRAALSRKPLAQRRADGRGGAGATESPQGGDPRAASKKAAFREMGSAGAEAHPMRLEADTAALLICGGDERLVLDACTGLNRYGCGPVPEPGVTAFSSSTASTISPAGFAAAQALHERLLAFASPAEAYAAAAADLRLRLAAQCGLPPAQAKAIILSPSGTDVHRVAAKLARGSSSAPLAIVLPEPCETGRGVPAALQISGRIHPVRVREDDGRPRAGADVDGDVERACKAAIAGSGRVLLCLLDQSKTGLVAPSAACVHALRRQFGDAVSILVDACQFRLSPLSLRAYLDAGFDVAVTGSKFVGGPAFSGALLRPLGAEAVDEGAEAPNLGLLLRWEAAMTELAAFRALPDASVAALICDFGRAVEDWLDRSPTFERLPAPPLSRPATDAWDAQPTIFSFLPIAERRPLSATATQALFARLSGVRLGQPVPVGQCAGEPVSALRLALGARQITAALTRGDGARRLIGEALEALDRTATQIAAAD